MTQRNKKPPRLQISDFYLLPEGQIVRVLCVNEDGQAGKAYDCDNAMYDIEYATSERITRKTVGQRRDRAVILGDKQAQRLDQIWFWMYEPSRTAIQTELRRHVNRIRDISQQHSIPMSDVVQMLAE